MTVYLTSDLHFGHQLVSDLRGYSSTGNHDEAVLASLEGLGGQDDLWVLGDLSATRRHERRALQLLGTLPCRLHLVEGNHDSVASIHRDGWKRQREFLEVFTSVQAFSRKRATPARVPVLLSHYPYAGDHTAEDRYGYARLRDTGAWLLHGHTHSTSVMELGPREIHVGWDAWRRPVAWDEIENIIENGYEEV